MKILSIDGGGYFALSVAYLLNKYGMEPKDSFEAFTGTSAGSNLIISYALDNKTEEVYNTYINSAPKIFKKDWKHYINPGDFFCPKFSNKGLIKEYQRQMPGKFGEIIYPIIVPTFDYYNFKPKVFDNISGDNPDYDWMAWEVAVASSSAPTYFPSYRGFIDGGMIANNPSMTAVLGFKNKLDMDIEEMEVLSLGTGYRNNQHKKDPKNLLAWASSIVDVMLVGGNEMFVDFQMKQIPLKNYQRFSGILLEEDWDIDDCSLTEKLIDHCDNAYDEFKEVLDKFFE